jgi:hypothetical protein
VSYFFKIFQCKFISRDFDNYFILGNDTDKSVDAVTNGFKGLNNDFYIFDFNNNEWYITTADELTNPSYNIPKLFSSSTSAEISSNRSQLLVHQCWVY